MHPSRKRAIGLALAICAGATVAPCAESASVLRSPAGGGLRANDVSTVSWSLDPAVLAGRDEMELVLSLDGGATFPIRVTGGLSTGLHTLAWRVPALASERAVLALRAGEDDESETIVASSEPFEIASDPESAPEPLFPVADEWRTAEALDGAPVRAPSLDLASTDGGPEISSADGDRDESETPPMLDADDPSIEGGAVTSTPPLSEPATPPRLATSLPLPLRI